LAGFGQPDSQRVLRNRGTLLRRLSNRLGIYCRAIQRPPLGGLFVSRRKTDFPVNEMTLPIPEFSLGLTGARVGMVVALRDQAFGNPLPRSQA